MRLQRWVWLVYPLLSLVFMVVSLNFLLGQGAGWLAKLQSQQKSMETDQQRLSKLKTKLDLLKNVQVSKEKQRLQLLNNAVPTTNQLWVLISELKQAGVVSNYSGVNDAELTVNFDVSEISKLKNTVSILEKLLPLVDVKTIEFTEGKAKMIVDSRWKLVDSVATSVTDVLPEYESVVAGVESKLQGYSLVQLQQNSGSESAGFRTNPF